MNKMNVCVFFLYTRSRSSPCILFLANPLLILFHWLHNPTAHTHQRQKTKDR